MTSQYQLHQRGIQAAKMVLDNLLSNRPSTTMESSSSSTSSTSGGGSSSSPSSSPLSSLSLLQQKIPLAEIEAYRRCRMTVIPSSVIPLASVLSLLMFSTVTALSKRVPFVKQYLYPHRTMITIGTGLYYFQYATGLSSSLTIPCYIHVLCGPSDIAKDMRNAYRNEAGNNNFIQKAEELAMHSASSNSSSSSTKVSTLPSPSSSTEGSSSSSSHTYPKTDINDRLLAILPYIPHPTGTEKTSQRQRSNVGSSTATANDDPKNYSFSSLPSSSSNTDNNNINDDRDYNFAEQSPYQDNNNNHVPENSSLSSSSSPGFATSTDKSFANRSPIENGKIRWVYDYSSFEDTDGVDESIIASNGTVDQMNNNEDTFQRSSNTSGGGGEPSYVLRRKRREALWSGQSGSSSPNQNTSLSSSSRTTTRYASSSHLQ